MKKLHKIFLFSILYIRNTLSLLIIIFMYNLIICGNIFAESLTYEYTVKENNISKESDEFIYSIRYKLLLYL